MNKTVGWIIVIVAFIVLAAGVFVATRHSQKVDATAAGNATGFGRAYDPTTGNTVAADAKPGAVGGPAPDVVSPVVATSPAAATTPGS